MLVNKAVVARAPQSAHLAENGFNLNPNPHARTCDSNSSFNELLKTHVTKQRALSHSYHSVSLQEPHSVCYQQSIIVSRKGIVRL